MGKRAKRAGRTLTLGVTAPLTAAGVAAAKLAIDAEETASKFNTVLGPAAASVDAEIGKMMETIPATRAQLRDAVADMTALGKAAGLSAEEARGLSTQFVTAAADLASFQNVPIDQALEAIRSGLVGASEPLRQFGIDVREGALETIALEEGLIKSGEEMDSSARAAAVFAAIQRDATDAMGDAERTADSTANQLKFMRRDIEELATKIGKDLIPALKPAIEFLADMLERFNKMPESVRGAAVVMGVLAAALGPLLSTFGALAPAIAKAIRKLHAYRTAAVAAETASTGAATSAGGLRVALASMSGLAVGTVLAGIAGAFAAVRVAANDAREAMRNFGGESEMVIDTGREVRRSWQQAGIGAANVSQSVADASLQLSKHADKNRELVPLLDAANSSTQELDTSMQGAASVFSVANASAQELSESGEGLAEAARSVRNETDLAATAERERNRVLDAVKGKTEAAEEATRNLTVAERSFQLEVQRAIELNRERQANIDRIISGLEEENRQLQMNSTELLIYNLRQQGATEAEIERAVQLDFQNAVLREVAENNRRAADEVEDGARRMVSATESSTRDITSAFDQLFGTKLTEWLGKWGKWIENLLGGLGGLGVGISGLIGDIGGWFDGLFDSGGGLGRVIGNVGDWASDFGSTMVSKLGMDGVFGKVAGFIGGPWGQAIMTGLDLLGIDMNAAIQKIGEVAVKGLKSIGAGLSTVATGIVGGVVSIFSNGKSEAERIAASFPEIKKMAEEQGIDPSSFANLGKVDFGPARDTTRRRGTGLDTFIERNNPTLNDPVLFNQFRNTRTPQSFSNRPQVIQVKMDPGDIVMNGRKVGEMAGQEIVRINRTSGVRL